MKYDFETKFTGASMVLAGLMLWAGWALSSHHVGEYFKADDFAEIGKSLWYWIWMYRIHIFGWVIMAVSLFSLIVIIAEKPARIIAVPGAGITIVGTFILALAFAYFYSYGAWGSGQTAGKSAMEIQKFTESLLVTDQYAACLVRFGRVFSGLGMLLLGFALFKWRIVQAWLGALAMIHGLASMAVIMLITDNFEIYKPLFHLKVIWLVSMGTVIYMKGVRVNISDDQ